MAQSGTPLAVVLLGKTGSGKSTLCNVLTCSNAFPTGRGVKSKTLRCQRKTASTSRGKLTVVDTPGTQDTANKDQANAKISRALQGCRKGIDAFLVLIRCDNRLTDGECKAIEEAVDAFGPECYKRGIVVFTYGNVYGNDETEFGNDLVEIRKSNQRFDQLMSKFGNRWLLLDNRNCDEAAEVRERQVSRLLDMVDAVAKLNPQRFKKKDQEQAKKKSEKKIKALKETVKQLEKKMHSMQLQRLDDKLELQKKEQAIRKKLSEHQSSIREEEKKMNEMHRLPIEIIRENQLSVQSAISFGCWKWPRGIARDIARGMRAIRDS